MHFRNSGVSFVFTPFILFFNLILLRILSDTVHRFKVVPTTGDRSGGKTYIMGEIKSVKVDNWGVFFLQKLQNFFNKTDYCDLTLQFRDNSQLKVHRLVLSACTDFFNVLEQTCELIDDALVMPMELQADVVVPIVNFMYTGTLEFELKMYGKLLKTAKEMNMTVLLKLLEAHKRTMDGTKQGSHRPGSPKLRGKRTTVNSPTVARMPASPSTISQLPQRRLVSSTNSTIPVRRIVPGKVGQGTPSYKPSGISFIKTSPKMQRGPTRFETTDQTIHGDTFESSFDAISYESKPLKDEPEDYEEQHTTPARSGSSPFEQLRKGYNNNKRPAVSTFTSPPAKKPNIEDVKEFAEQQRMRKQIAAEYGDDAEYDGIMDDEFHNDDDDDEPSTGGTTAPVSKQQQSPQVQPQASIIIKQSPNEKPTIVVKDNSNSKMDHAKIISEVLRQYPHLVKSNKNIKLKIMPNVGNSTQKIVMKKEASDSDTEKAKPSTAAQEQARQQLLQLSQTSAAKKAQIAKPAPVKIEAQSTVQPAVAASTTGQPSVAPQKRRIDSKTMHALIALGAENTTGPWLCLRCGVNGRPISIPSYRGFRRHLINTHKEVIDSALCEHCGWRSTSSRTLSHHMLVEHKIPSSLYTFPNCEHCSKICVDPNDLNRHVSQEHPNVHKQQCIYCNKVFSKEIILYNHMKSFHKKRAREDGVIDFSDEEMTEFDEEMKELLPEEDPAADKKIKIISDISLPSTLLKLDDVSVPQEDDYANDSGPKFVNADGNEMVLTAEQRDEIMSQLDQDHGGGVVMVLNEPTFAAGEGAAAVQEEEKLEAGEGADENEDSQVYSEYPHESEAGFNANDTSAEESALEGSKDEDDEAHDQENQESEPDERMDVEHMEWAENVISAHDADEEEANDDEDEEETEKEEKTQQISAKKEEKEQAESKETTKTEKTEDKKEDDISLKLKMLTGDWTDDEIEDEEEEDTIGQIAKESAEEQSADTADSAAAEEEIEKESQEEPVDSIEKEDAENAPVAEAVDTEEEVSQSSHSEKNLEKILKDEVESPVKPLKSEAESAIKSEDSSDTQPETLEAIEREVKRKSSTNSRGSTSSRRTSVKDEADHTEEQAAKVADGFMEEEPLNVKATSPKKTPDDPLAELTSDEYKETTDVKEEAENTQTEPIKPAIEENLKTADKVKSLISEWVDDEDDI